MVEELARWKSALSTRITELQEIVKKLLDEKYKVQKKSLKTYCLLQGTLKKFDGNKICGVPKTSSVVDLSNINCDLSQEISELVDVDREQCDDLYMSYLKLPQYTVAESSAMKVNLVHLLFYET